MEQTLNGKFRMQMNMSLDRQSPTVHCRAPLRSQRSRSARPGKRRLIVPHSEISQLNSGDSGARGSSSGSLTGWQMLDRREWRQDDALWVAEQTSRQARCPPPHFAVHPASPQYTEAPRHYHSSDTCVCHCHDHTPRKACVPAACMLPAFAVVAQHFAASQCMSTTASPPALTASTARRRLAMQHRLAPAPPCNDSCCLCHAHRTCGSSTAHRPMVTKSLSC